MEPQKHDTGRLPGAPCPALQELESWLEQQIQSYKTGAMMSLAESVEGEAIFISVLEKLRTIQQQNA